MRRFVEGVDRLVVLSNKPAQVRKVIDITLPRPRNPETVKCHRVCHFRLDCAHERYGQAGIFICAVESL